MKEVTFIRREVKLRREGGLFLSVDGSPIRFEERGLPTQSGWVWDPEVGPIHTRWQDR